MPRAVDVWDGRFGVEFRAVDGSVVSGDWSRLWATRFEEVAPARSFCWFKGQRNYPGYFWSATAMGHVGFESWLERDNLMLLDRDPRVVGISSQPFWLSWRDDRGRARRHLPDYFARLEDGRAMVVDVRADDRIGERDAEAFAATRAACALAGWEFRRVGALDPVFAANLRWIARYRHPRFAGREELRARVAEAFARDAGLFDGAGRVGDRLEVLPVVYHLLWRGIICTDLDTHVLTLGSVVCRAAP